MTVCWVHDGEKTVTIGSNNERMPSRFGPPCNNSAPSVFFLVWRSTDGRGRCGIGRVRDQQAKEEPRRSPSATPIL
jgi:hypothetical protein